MRIEIEGWTFQLRYWHGLFAWVYFFLRKSRETHLVTFCKSGQTPGCGEAGLFGEWLSPFTWDAPRLLWLLAHKFAKNNRTMYVGRDLWKSWSPASCSRVGLMSSRLLGATSSQGLSISRDVDPQPFWSLLSVFAHFHSKNYFLHLAWISHIPTCAF